MTLDSLNFDDNRIKSLDTILEKLSTNPSAIVTFEEPNMNLFRYLRESADTLNKLGLTKQFTSSTYQIVLKITTEGKLFTETNSFHMIKQKREEEKRLEDEKIEQNRTQHQVNKNALRAAKREPWLIAWSIISTLVATLLAIFK